MNKQELIEELKKEIEVTKNGFIREEHVNLYEKGKRVGLEYGWMFAEKLDEPELPVIPQFVADWIKKHKDPIFDMCATCEMWGLNGDDGTTDFTKELVNWFDDNTKTYYRACQDGYTIEKEPHYYVRKNNYLLCKYNNEVIDYVEAVEREITDLVELKLTEKEIKDYDERYWVFAEPLFD